MNGIGGSTIAEAMSKISYPEFLIWVSYRKKRGPLNVGRRIEKSVALLASLYANAHSSKRRYSWTDFAPYEEETGPISLEQAMRDWA